MPDRIEPMRSIGRNLSGTRQPLPRPEKAWHERGTPTVQCLGHLDVEEA
jgi:hypothetical protein